MSEKRTKHETLNQYFIQLVHLARLRRAASWKEVSPTCPFICSDDFFFWRRKYAQTKSMGAVSPF